MSGRCPSFADTVSEPKKTEINVGVRHDVPSVSTGCPAAIVEERRSTIVAVAVGVRRPFSPATALYPVRRRNGGCQGVHVRGKYPPALGPPHTSGVTSPVFDEYVSVHFRSKGYIHACICAPSVYGKRVCMCVCVCSSTFPANRSCFANGRPPPSLSKNTRFYASNMNYAHATFVPCPATIDLLVNARLFVVSFIPLWK